MTTATKDLALVFNVNRLVLVEKTLGRTIAQIVEELESGAPSLGTMRALLAAGIMDGRFLALTGMALPLDLGAAGDAMEQHGTKAVSAAIGKAMADFLSSLGR